MSVEIDRKDLETWAGILLDHSIGGVTPDDVVMIKGEHVAWPLMSILQDRVFAAGAIADVCLVPPDNHRGRVWGASIARHGTVAQIERTPDWHRARYEAMTKYVEVMGAESPELFENLPDETGRALVRADEPFKTIRLLKPWVITLYPTAGFARMEEMSLDEYAQVVVQASIYDPRLLEEAEEPLYQLMFRSRLIRVVTEEPSGRRLELRMDIGGRRIVKCTGHRNVPDGEVFTSPDARTVEGEVFLDLPVYQGGETIQGIYLRFAGGVIREYRAERGHQALAAIIETDAGSRRVGEIALGTNAGMTRVLRHPLFVEKVGGTLHLAVGGSYPECYVEDPASPEGRSESDRLAAEGILNRSAQHVDLVADFRPGGAGREVWLDGTRLSVRDNQWVAG
ncbi:MAG: aminopeptidase [Acidobacteriota bacterium]